MLDSIMKYFTDHLEPGAGREDNLEQQLRLATAALLFEVSRSDNRISQDEHDAITRGVQDKFGLTDAETAELTELAQTEAEASVSYFGFTSLINEHFDQDKKERVIELMWRIAAADGHVDMHEEALVRKIADLLYLPHQAFIAAKLRVLEGNADSSQ